MFVCDLTFDTIEAKFLQAEVPGMFFVVVKNWRLGINPK